MFNQITFSSTCTASLLYGKCCSASYICRSRHVKKRIGH